MEVKGYKPYNDDDILNSLRKLSNNGCNSWRTRDIYDKRRLCEIEQSNASTVSVYSSDAGRAYCILLNKEDNSRAMPVKLEMLPGNAKINFISFYSNKTMVLINTAKKTH